MKPLPPEASQTGPVTLAVADGIAVVTIDNPPVNALGAAVRAGLLDAVRRAAADPGVMALVVAAHGKTFIAGADITEFGKPPRSPTLPEVLDAFDEVSKPIVAAIGGAALGGGLEVALGCHARVASSGAKFGLPEVKLGLLPGAGGTQRLPRLIGPAQAIKLMTEGDPIGAWDAVALGLVDEVAAGDVVAAAAARARVLAHSGPLRRSRDRTDRIAAPGAREAFEQHATVVMRRAGDSPGAVACVEAVRAVFETSFEDGLAIERARFLRLLDDPRSKALRHVFFAERESARIPGLPPSTAARTVERAAVIGAGTMGGGIAICFANAGVPVNLIETAEEALRRGLDRVAKTYDASVTRGSLTPEARDARLGLIDGKVGLEAAAGADVIVEAAFEEMELKREIFGTLGRIARPGAVLATNTSYLDVDEIAAASGRPQDVLGMHFFSPANVMRLLEVVRGAKTAPDALVTAVALGRRLGKVSVVSGVCHGFIGNRMLARRTVEAERLLIEGASPQEVDAAITGFGFRMGPFAMADLAGLDIGWRIRKAQGRRAPIADALCEAGRLGQKTGKGYYLYPDGARTGQPDLEVERLIADVAARLGVTRRPIPQEEILERLLYPMINEGARILEEGIAARSGDIDVVWINGYGWPAWRGGPMFHARQVGLPRIVARLEEFAARTGEQSLTPAPLLRRLADENRAVAPLESA